MTDIALQWNAALGEGDLGIAAGDLAADASGLRTAVLLSLFSDRRAPDPGAGADPRGWWGDRVDDASDDAIGSLLWLIERETERPEVAARAEGYARDALTWLIEDGIADRVGVSAEWTARGTLGISVTLFLHDERVFQEAFEAPSNAS